MNTHVHHFSYRLPDAKAEYEPFLCVCMRVFLFVLLLFFFVCCCCFVVVVCFVLFVCFSLLLPQWNTISYEMHTRKPIPVSNTHSHARTRCTTSCALLTCRTRSIWRTLTGTSYFLLSMASVDARGQNTDSVKMTSKLIRLI